MQTGAPLEAKPSGNKVNGTCGAFIDVLSKKFLSKNLQNVITAYVCKNPPDHESALNLIITLKGVFGVLFSGVHAMLNKRKGKESYEQAITHICFLSDINKLYDTALGIYDLDVALMIAQQAQKVFAIDHSYFYRLTDVPGP